MLLSGHSVCSANVGRIKMNVVTHRVCLFSVSVDFLLAAVTCCILILYPARQNEGLNVCIGNLPQLYLLITFLKSFFEHRKSCGFLCCVRLGLKLLPQPVG